MGKKIGRPSIFTKEIAEKICERLALGETLRGICIDDGMPDVRTVLGWLVEPGKKEFSHLYAQARLAQAQHLFDELMEIADDGRNDWVQKQLKNGETATVLDQEHVQRSRLRVDTRKWYLSKVLPKVYGDKVDMTTNGKDLPVPILNVRRNNSDTESHGNEEADQSDTGGDISE